MNAGTDQLVTSLIGKKSLGECTIAELQGLTAQYPYFSPAHFLLTQKLKKEDTSQYEKQLQKTSLYFQNPLWLEYLLTNNVVNNENSFEKDETYEEDQQIAETILPEEKNNEQQETENDINKQAPAEIEQTELEVLAETIVTSPDPEMEQEILKEEEQLIAEEVNTETHEEESASDLNQPELKIQLPQFKIEPVNPTTARLAFEPYHTVDYFASQGISLKEEEKPKDKFGQQLKSFTEWLKTMKKLPESEIIVPQIVLQDPKVEQLAEHSVAEREVVTETMADIWEKQGDHAKAIETYRKLSLLNPDKSSYFAAKIEYLKHS